MARTTTTPDAIPHSVLPTVLDYRIPATRGKMTTSAIPVHVPVPPCVYKRRRRASLKGVGRLSRHHTALRAHALTSSSNIATLYA